MTVVTQLPAQTPLSEVITPIAGQYVTLGPTSDILPQIVDLTARNEFDAIALDGFTLPVLAGYPSTTPATAMSCILTLFRRLLPVWSISQTAELIAYPSGPLGTGTFAFAADLRQPIPFDLASDELRFGYQIAANQPGNGSAIVVASNLGSLRYQRL